MLCSDTPRLLTLDLRKAHAALNQEEHRAQRRLPACLMAFIRSLSTANSARELAPVWDISPVGIGLLFHRRLEQGELLDVHFRRGLTQDRVGTVVHTSALKESWLIGCTLDLPLSASELRALAE
jgi:hypothetical protein